MKSNTLITVTSLLLCLSATASSAHAAIKDLDADGIPNRLDRDVDNDRIPNRDDRNVDGGTCKRGPKKGQYIGDRLSNGSLAEKDIDDDGKADDSPLEKDIDGDGVPDQRDEDADGDGKANHLDDDCDGDGRTRDDDDDDDGDEINDDDDKDDDNDGALDEDDLGEVEAPLTGSENAPERSRARVKISRSSSGEIELTIESRGLPSGVYQITVNGTAIGDLEMLTDGDRTEGQSRFTTGSEKKVATPLSFDPSGLPVAISQDRLIFFTGTIPVPIL
jgi:hypothetical protein